MSSWYTGSGYEVEYDDLLQLIKEHTESGGKIYVGTDSFLNKNRCVFATAVCFTKAGKREGAILYKEHGLTESNLRFYWLEF